MKKLFQPWTLHVLPEARAFIHDIVESCRELSDINSATNRKLCKVRIDTSRATALFPGPKTVPGILHIFNSYFKWVHRKENDWKLTKTLGVDKIPFKYIRMYIWSTNICTQIHASMLTYIYTHTQTTMRIMKRSFTWKNPKLYCDTEKTLKEMRLY